MHTHLLINFVTRTEGIPEGVLIRAIEPDEGIGAMNVNRGKSGYELTNGPGKWTKAFNIPRSIDGSTLNDCKLSIDTNHRKYPKTIVESGRIGIPNKGEWTNKPLRFTVKGNPYVSRMRKSDFQNPDDTWKKKEQDIIICPTSFSKFIQIKICRKVHFKIHHSLFIENTSFLNF